MSHSLCEISACAPDHPARVTGQEGAIIYIARGTELIKLSQECIRSALRHPPPRVSGGGFLLSAVVELFGIGNRPEEGVSRNRLPRDRSDRDMNTRCAQPPLIRVQFVIGRVKKHV